MTWTTPVTRATGYLVLASVWNNEHVNNLLALTPIAYVEATGNVSITGTTEAGATTLLDTGSLTYTGIPISIEAWLSVSLVSGFAVGDVVTLVLFDGSTALGQFGPVEAQEAATTVTEIAYVRRRLTPSAATHQYFLAAFHTGSGTAQMNAGAGGTTTQMPSAIRVVGSP